MQFSNMIRFRALVDPTGDHCKGVIIQGVQIKRRFSYSRGL